jgi:protoporphyrinogen oxidase
VAPEELDAEQARRRVSAGSLAGLLRKVMSAVPGRRPPGAGRFFYPRRGFGQISEAYAEAASTAGARLRMETRVTAVERDEHGVTAIRMECGDEQRRLPSALTLSTIPLPSLARLLEPPAPVEALRAADSLRYRSMILIYLVLETDRFTEFDAHYFPGADIPITRLSEPGNYGLAGSPGRTVLCAELPCSTADRWWTASDADLGEMAADALDRAGLPLRAPCAAVATRRLAQAYPIYTLDYRAHFDALDRWLHSLDGLLSLGRQGLFAHDNTHHTLAMAYAACSAIDDHGRVDRDRWALCRRSFESFVVED